MHSKVLLFSGPFWCATKASAAYSCSGASGCRMAAAMLSQKLKMLPCRCSLVLLLMISVDKSPSKTARAWLLALQAPAASAGSGELHVTPFHEPQNAHFQTVLSACTHACLFTRRSLQSSRKSNKPQMRPSGTITPSSSAATRRQNSCLISGHERHQFAYCNLTFAMLQYQIG